MHEWDPAPCCPPRPCPLSPLKFSSSFCQGDISILPVSMATQRQVSGEADACGSRHSVAWGALPTGHPRCAHGLGVPTLWGVSVAWGVPVLHGVPVVCGSP